MGRIPGIKLAFMFSAVAVALFANAQSSKRGGDAVGNGRSLSGPGAGDGGGMDTGGGRSANGTGDFAGRTTSGPSTGGGAPHMSGGGSIVGGARSSGGQDVSGRTSGREEGGGFSGSGGIK